MFVVLGSVFADCCFLLLFVVCCVLFVVDWCLLFVACCLLFAVCCLLLLGCWLLFVGQIGWVGCAGRSVG